MITGKTFTIEDVEATKGQSPALSVTKGVVYQRAGMMASMRGGKDSTLTECLRVRVIDSLAEMGDDHKAWLNVLVAEMVIKTKNREQFGLGPTDGIVGMTNFSEYDF